ncbi:hypothetical protein PI125_g21515 [Phytophthora idaei]|nr:hypothetical protein PI125_g21515 [Phytophthora idaei]
MTAGIDRRECIPCSAAEEDHRRMVAEAHAPEEEAVRLAQKSATPETTTVVVTSARLGCVIFRG